MKTQNYVEEGNGHVDSLVFLAFCAYKQTLMASLHSFILPLYILTIFTRQISIAAYTLSSSQSLIDGQTLISQGGKFELGFFSPPGSKNRYLGIWYKTIPLQTAVWVANRDSPLYDTSGVVNISSNGNIVILNQTQIIWSSNSSKPVQNTVVEFLAAGNLILKDVRNGDLLWQSFDYPGDTLLPDMKLGWDLKTGMDRHLSAWRSSDDPSDGGFTYGMDISGYLETAIRNGSRQYYRGGPWNGVRHSGATDLKPNPIFTYQVIHNDDEIYYMYQLVNQSVVMRFVLTQTGAEAHLQRYTWVDRANNWVLLVSIPRDRCDDYALCGVYSTCDVSNVAVCTCLDGFKPKSPEDWRGTDWSEGCEREVSVNCSQGEGFVKYTGVKLPDTSGVWVNTSLNLEECRVKCLNNCSCMAYSSLDIREGGSGCIMWFTDLIDIRQLSDAGQDLYIRMAASELDSKAKSKRNTLVIVVASVTVVVGVIVLCLGIWCIWKKRSSKGGAKKDDLELPLYDLVTITSATNNFSEWNKLGEGGFGPVYKGRLEGDQDIAVKRLSKESIQGGIEFMNEVILISKLQHRNLVKLLGCCIQGEEKLLVYEYMENKSLDSFIFDGTKGRLLDWQMRFDIILGIARGLLYLHHDSRLRIIHRDLKASNVLLDSEMIPKISDFGMARMFGGDQTQAETKRVVGTYGYMSPEYAMDGLFSVKSDVFSFGVLVLEIISGRKNRGFSHPDHEHNLLGHAWRLWNDGKSLELVDGSIEDSCFGEDVVRCIHVGLLCVQKNTQDRPNMSSAVLMLSSETIVLPRPQRPGFYIERSTHSVQNSPQYEKGDSISRDITVTMVQGR